MCLLRCAQQRRAAAARRKETARQAARERRAADPETARQSDRDRQSSPVRRAWQRVFALRRYGLTQADADRILAAQGGCCAICHVMKPGGRGSWHVDHDHVTGRVRGLLCHKCNTGIGLFGDNPMMLEVAVRYLRSTT